MKPIGPVNRHETRRAQLHMPDHLDTSRRARLNRASRPSLTRHQRCARLSTCANTGVVGTNSKMKKGLALLEN